MKAILTLILGLFLSNWIMAQSPSYLRFDFIRQNNFTYSSQLDYKYLRSFGKYKLDARLRHNILLNSKRLDQPFVQFHIAADILQLYELNRSLSLASWFESDQFLSSGNQRYNTYVGIEYRWKDILQIRPFLGYSWDHRSMVWDHGISPALQVRSRYTSDNKLISETRLNLRLKYIRPRHQRNFLLRQNLIRTFENDATLAFQAYVASNEQDDYKLNSVEKIIADTLGTAINLSYKLFPNVNWQSENEISLTRRKFNYARLDETTAEFNDLSYNQIHLLTRQRLSFQRKKWDSFFLFQYEFIDRGYQLENSQALSEPIFEQELEQEIQKDYRRNLNQFELAINYQLNPKNKLTIIGTNRYLMYDSPSEDNFDDHDEIDYGLTTSWNARWSNRFTTTYKLSGNKRQYAFLFKERSQDNYSQYAIRMGVNFQWSILSNLFLEGEQKVYATYNVKDFIDRNLTDRSTRNLQTNIRLIYRPSSQWNSSLQFQRRETHVSYLNWQAFTETTLDTNRTSLFEFTEEYILKKQWKASVISLNAGYKHFILSRRFNTSMIDLSNTFQPINLKDKNFQTGPQTGIQIKKRDQSSISLSIWWQYQFQKYKFKTIEDLTTLSSTFREEDLLVVTRTFRPFIKLRLNWNLVGK